MEANKEHAFGLPKNTVRATLAILVVGGWLAGCFMQIPQETLTGMSGLTGAVVAFYFAKA